MLAVTLPLSYRSTFLKRPKVSKSKFVFPSYTYLVATRLEETFELQW